MPILIKGNNSLPQIVVTGSIIYGRAHKLAPNTDSFPQTWVEELSNPFPLKPSQ